MTARRQGNVVADIKRAVNPDDYDLLTAEGRADFDDALRTELAKIFDERLREHAAQMIRDWRVELFNSPACADRLGNVNYRARHG
jgi:hypothetical protein